MDEQLAQIYGTGQTYDEDDIEKTAAAELLVKLAEEEGVDLSQFSDEDIAEMLQELYSGETKTAEEEKKESKEHEKKETPAEEKKEEEAKEKAAEADFLGRVMAHAMVQELNNIEKEAGVKDKAQAAYHGAKRGLRRVGELLKGGKKVTEGGSRSVHEGGERAGNKRLLHNILAGGEGRREALKSLGTRAGAAGAAAGAGVAAHKAMSKKGSALETMAEKRAYEMLAQSGWVDQDGDLIAPQAQTKEASAVEQEVEVRALQILEENGYPVEWNQ